MSGNNPFSHGGWANPLASYFANSDHDKTTQTFPPSIYGALPSGPSTPIPFSPPRMNVQQVHAPVPSHPASSMLLTGSSSTVSQLQILTLHFTSVSNTVLNSTVIGAQGRKLFTIATHGVGNTVIINEQQSNTSGEAVGKIEWQKHPYVVMADSVARQMAGQWMALSADCKFRTMTARGRDFNWVPTSGMICLYTAGHNPSEFLARISKGREGSGVMVVLDISSKAVQAGLLDICVLSAVLFHSGRHFD